MCAPDIRALVREGDPEAAGLHQQMPFAAAAGISVMHFPRRRVD